MRKKTIISWMLALMTILSIVFGSIGQSRLAIAAGVQKGYTISAGNTRVYSDRSFRNPSGWIYPSDEVVLNTITDSYCYVSYPTSRGTKSGFIPTSSMFLSTSGYIKYATSNITTYRRASGSTSYGYVAKGDKIIVLNGTKGGFTQIRYPISGNGYKYAFIYTRDIEYLSDSKENTSSKKNCDVANGWYKIKSAINTDYVFDIEGVSQSPGGNLQLWRDLENDAQKFYLEKNSDGYYVLTARCSGMALDVWQDSKAMGANIAQSAKTGAFNQQWKIYKTSDGYYSFKSRSNSYWMDVNAGVAGCYSNIQCWKENNMLSQKFVLEPVSVMENNGNGQNVTYAPYHGVDYYSSGLSQARIKALDKAEKMCMIKWVAPCNFPTWQSQYGVHNSVVSTDGTVSNHFIKGKTYIGIPYSMADHTYDEVKWKDFVQSGFTENQMMTRFNGRSETTAHGIDCSYFIFLCMKETQTANVTYLNTASMLNSSYYIKKNGLSEMKGGDILLKSGHVMLYIGRVGQNYAVFEADAEDSKVSYNVYSAASLSSYGVYKFRGFID